MRKSGYVARLSSRGKVLWVYRFRPDEAVPLSEEEDCGNAVTARGSDDVFVAGTFSGIPRKISALSNWPGQGTFVARISKTGELVWSRLVPETLSPVQLTMMSRDMLVAAGRRSQPWGNGLFLRALSESGDDMWILNADKAKDSSGWIGEPVVAARKEALILAAPFDQAVEVDGHMLHSRDRGVGLFVAKVDTKRALLSLDDVSPGLRRGRCASAVDSLTNLGVSDARSSLWVGANLEGIGGGAVVGLLSE